MRIVAFILVCLLLNGCQSAAFAYTNVYPNPLFSVEEKLSHAVRQGDVKQINNYLAKGANPNTEKYFCNDLTILGKPPDETLCTPPMIGVFGLSDKSIANNLINYGGDINRRYAPQGGTYIDIVVTPLSFWVLANNSEAIEEIIKLGGDVNEVMDISMSLLDVSVNFNDLTVTKLLLEAGANPNYLNDDGVGSLSRSVEHENIELSKALIDYGAKPDKFLYSFIKYFDVSSGYIFELYEYLNQTSVTAITIGNEVNSYYDDALYISKDGTRYRGSVKNNKYHGKGIVKNDKATLEGIWDNGVLLRGNLTTFDGIVFNGKFKNGNLTDGYVIVDGRKVLVNDSTYENAKLLSLISNAKYTSTESTYSNANSSENPIANVFLSTLGFVGDVIDSIDWGQVVREMPSAYLQAKKERERINNAYKKGVIEGRRKARNKVIVVDPDSKNRKPINK